MSTSFSSSGLLSPPAVEESVGPGDARMTLAKSVRRLFFFVIIPALLFAAIYSSNIDGAVDLFHEGESVTPAFETGRGELPFRDVYLQHGWGVNLLRAKLAFFLFGESLAAHRKLLFGVSGYLIPVVWIALYLLLYAIFRMKIWVLPAFLLLALADVMITDRHLLPFLSVALLAWGIRGPRLTVFFAGVLAGAAVFYSLDTGMYALAIGPAFLVACFIGDRSSSWRSAGGAAWRYLLGSAVGAMPFLLYLLRHHIVDDFLLNSFLQIRYQGETWGIAPPSLAALLGPFENVTARNRSLYLVIKWYYPVLIYLLASFLFLPRIFTRSLSREDAPVLLILLTGIGFLPSAFGRADEGHLMYAIAPFWILNVCLFEWATNHAFSESNGERVGSWPAFVRFPRRYCYAGLLGVLSIGLALYFWSTCRNGGVLQQKFRLASWKRMGMPGFVPLNVEQSGGILVPTEQAAEIEQTVAFISSHTGPEEPIFDFSNQGAYYFLARRRNSTAFCQAAYAVPHALQVKAVEQLQKSPPAAVIVRQDASYDPSEREPLIDEWIRSRYAEGARIGRNVILLPSLRE